MKNFQYPISSFQTISKLQITKFRHSGTERSVVIESSATRCYRFTSLCSSMTNIWNLVLVICLETENWKMEIIKTMEPSFTGMTNK